MKRSLSKYMALAALVVAFSSCDEKIGPVGGTDEPTPVVEPAVTKPSAEIQQADYFAQNMLMSYYLWSKEVESDVPRLTPDTCKSPVAVVEQIRYHQGSKEVDHWTSLTNDLGSFTNSVQGLGLTYGYDVQAGRISNKNGVYFLLICYVAKDSPAEKAGLKRGDVILTIDGSEITASNIYDALNTKYVSVGISNLVREGENSYLGPVTKVLDLEAVDMWEDPVLLTRTFDVNGKKVGYMVYNSFDLKSSTTLPDVFRNFKKEGIEELIIDLRYNGGGYAFTECELASMIAPSANVAAGDVFQTEVFNSYLADAWKNQGYDTNTYFSTKHEYASQGISEDVSDANPDVKKLYAIVTGSSASASEGLIVGLSPYMDVTLVGSHTYGKYCAGYMMSPEDLYGENSTVDYSKITKWGMYVMVSKFADKNGHNAAQPDGIPVQIEAADDPFDGYQLGDENETMLKAALTAAGKVYTRSAAQTVKPFRTEVIEHGMPRGILIRKDLPALK